MGPELWCAPEDIPVQLLEASVAKSFLFVIISTIKQTAGIYFSFYFVIPPLYSLFCLCLSVAIACKQAAALMSCCGTSPYDEVTLQPTDDETNRRYANTNRSWINQLPKGKTMVIVHLLWEKLHPNIYIKKMNLICLWLTYLDQKFVCICFECILNSYRQNVEVKVNGT